MFAILHIPSGTFLSSVAGKMLTPYTDIDCSKVKFQLNMFIYERVHSFLWLPEQLPLIKNNAAEEIYLIEEFEIIEV